MCQLILLAEGSPLGESDCIVVNHIILSRIIIKAGPISATMSMWAPGESVLTLALSIIHIHPMC